MNDLLEAKEIAGGFTWTLTSRLGDILTDLEEKFGPRDMSYTILGIEFFDDGPQIWYPKSQKHIIVQLSSSARNNLSQAIYQLAHEAVHLLNPSGENSASVLEEGLAAYYAWEYTQRNFQEDYSKKAREDYKMAGMLVKKLMETSPNAIKEIRKKFKSLSSISTTDLKTYAPILS